MKEKTEVKHKILNALFFSALFLLVAGLQAMASTTASVAETTQQGITVTGTVLDEQGLPLPGTSVKIKGLSQGTTTLSDGTFTLAVPNENAILEFSFLGFITQEVPVGNQRRFTVTLREDIQQIEEVVVVGYGQQRRVTLTGSVSQISGDEIISRPSPNVTNSLQGMMPGVMVLRSSGQPGSENAGLRIRGFTSVNSSGALVLIDGMEGSLTTLNPDDIESISVLKDAAAASIYGSRAAGGVVLVTTRKGSSQKIKITYNGSYGINVPGMMPQRMPSWEEQDMIVEARFNFNDIIEFPKDFTEWMANPNYKYDIHPSAINRYQAALGNTNWIAEGLRTYTYNQRHAVSLSGGQGNTTYFISAGYYNQNGLLKYGPDSNDRYNLRLNLRTEMNKYLDVNISAAFEDNAQFRNPSGAESLIGSLFTIRGREMMYLPESDINYEKDPYSTDLSTNPIRNMKYAGLSTSHRYYLDGSANIHFKNFVKGLTVDLNASRRFGIRSEQHNRVYLPGQGRNGPRGDYNTNAPSSNVQKIKNQSYQDKLEALVNYRLKINDHSVAVLAGASYEQYLLDQIDVRVYGLLSDGLFSLKYYESSDATNTAVTDAINQWKMASLFGRINYDYANRYLFEVVLRYDGSSRLGPGKRFGFFPGTSVGWVVSEESFFEGVKDYVNLMKFRGSYGQVGNSNAISGMYYPYIGTITRGNLFMGERMYSKNSMTSSDVSWETVTTTNIAVDLAFLKRRLTLTADYFWKTNNDMLSQMAPGNIVGISSLPNENVGVLKVWGWEITAGWRDKIGNVRYNVTFNIDDSRDKLVSYKGVNTISAGTVNLIEGYPMYTLWGYQTDGFWKSRDEYLAYKTANPGYQTWTDARISGGDVKYVAQGKADHTMGSIGAGTPDEPGDLVYYGDANPHYAFSFNLGVQWKNFDFSCFFQGIGKRQFFINSTAIQPLGNSGSMPWSIHKDYWKEDNQDAYFARLFESGSHNYQYSDRWIQNGAYIRLKNIQLGYTVPLRYVQSLRIYVTGNDSWEYTKVLKTFDPEVSNRTETSDSGINDRINRSFYPFMRAWTAGVNLTF